MNQGDYITTPDGLSAKVLLCAGDWVTVWLTNVHWDRAKRIRHYAKSAFPRPDLIGRITK